VISLGRVKRLDYQPPGAVEHEARVVQDPQSEVLQ
jgi:hypothetical protein